MVLHSPSQSDELGNGLYGGWWPTSPRPSRYSGGVIAASDTSNTSCRTGSIHSNERRQPHAEELFSNPATSLTLTGGRKVAL
jgi:hypothetical protein